MILCVEDANYFATFAVNYYDMKMFVSCGSGSDAIVCLYWILLYRIYMVEKIGVCGSREVPAREPSASTRSLGLRLVAGGVRWPWVCKKRIVASSVRAPPLPGHS